MVEDIPFIQSVLYKSPYSGCNSFSGWKGNCCVDPTKKPAQGSMVLQRVHFRPSMPYPGAVIGAGTEGLRAMPPMQRRQIGKPPYDLKPIQDPSSTGPFTYAVGTGIPSSGGADLVVGTAGNQHHNLGLS